jgi:thiol:disulfide interchange protein DsbC
LKRLKKLSAIIVLLAVSTSACAGEQEVAAKLKKSFPRLAFETVSPSPIKGLYEVTAGNNVIYFDPVSGHMIFGEMWSPTGVNITAAAKDKIMATKYDSIKKHLPAAIKIGSGPNEVIEIIDPDCPFCRRMNDFWKKRIDVTRYVFLMPLTQLHPQAKAHSDYILSAVAPGKALDDVESGKFDKTQLSTFALNDARIRAQAESLISGINGTPAYFINGAFVNGANVPQIEKLLKGGK